MTDEFPPLKDASHSPACIEFAPYEGVCAVTCRLYEERESPFPQDKPGINWDQDGLVVRNAAGEEVYSLRDNKVKKGDLIGWIGNPIKQEFGKYVEPFQPAGHGLNIEFSGGSESVTDRETFQRNPYLLTNPRACLQHEMAWHWKDQISCEEFETDLDNSVGFADFSDEGAIESRAFRVGQSGTVQVYANKYKRERKHALLWRKIAFIAIPLGVAANVISAANAFNWWGW